MKCPNCSNDVKDGMKFCPKCGSDIPQMRICPNCGAEVKEGLEFCSKCGTRINNTEAEHLQATSKEEAKNSSNITCPICSSPLKIDDKACPNCHRSLSYRCTTCNNDFTYGEVIMNKGYCPNCGIRMNTLYNIPNEKYPFYEADTQPQEVTTDEEEETSVWNKVKKYTIYGLIFFVCYYYGPSLLGSCLGCGGSSGMSSMSYSNLRTEIRVALDTRGFECLDVTNIEQLPETSDYQYKFEAQIKIQGVLRKRISGLVTLNGFGEVDQLAIYDYDLDK